MKKDKLLNIVIIKITIYKRNNNERRKKKDDEI